MSSPRGADAGVASHVRAPSWSAIVWGTVFGVLTLLIVGFAVETALHFAGPPIDGPFQMYNALRRIAAGQRPGVDFQFFHGIGIPYLHYLPFRLMGASFTASELTRQFLATLCGPIALIVFFRVFTGDWRRTFALSTTVLCLTIALGMWPMVLAINSLVGLRATLPTVMPVLWILPIRPRIRSAVIGIGLGGSILLGTEQGLAVLAAFVIVQAIIIARSSDRRSCLVEGLIALAAAVLTVVVPLIAIGGISGMEGALYYNLKLVPMDQYWYFGAPPNAFITSWSGIWPLMADIPLVPIGIIVGIITFAVVARRLWREPAGATGRRTAALTILILYGLISCASLLGIFLVTYVEPCLRAVLMIATLELDRALRHKDLPPVGWRRRVNIASLEFVAAGSLLVMLAAEPAMIETFVMRFPHVVVAHIFRHEGMKFEGIWPATLATGQKVVDAHRQPNGSPPTLWSTYAGLLEARNGIVHPSTDYIIHALGPDNRARYVERFRALRPTLVQTVVPTYTPYETWIEQTSWDFYSELIRNYRVIDGTPWSIFWERLPSTGAAPRLFWSEAVTATSHSVDIPMPAPAGKRPNAVLIQVSVTYRVHNPLGLLPIVGALPRYLVLVSGAITRPPVTLDPYTTTARFPIVATEGATVRLDFATYSLLPDARIDVSAVSASAYHVTAAFFPWLYNFGSAGAPPPSQ